MLSDRHADLRHEVRRKPGEGAAADGLTGDDPEEHFDEVEP
jgi:hypothetical protein